MLMVVLAVMGVSMMAAGKQWALVIKREKEAELVFRANRIKNAIEAYALDYRLHSASRPNQFPLSLQQLTKPPKRYLSTVYQDPVSGLDFELIKVAGQIRGVRSRSHEPPLSRVQFGNARVYREVAFQVDSIEVQPCMARGVNPMLGTACQGGGMGMLQPSGPTFPSDEK
jgi:type II secretory pathway pseudopilin PulG